MLSIMRCSDRQVQNEWVHLGYNSGLVLTPKKSGRKVFNGAIPDKELSGSENVKIYTPNSYVTNEQGTVLFNFDGDHMHVR